MVGSRCVREYARLRRYPVFSHEELLFRMSEDEKLPAHQVHLVFYELQALIRQESKRRRHLLDLGVHQSVQIPFETMGDEERQCKHCRCTCYMSALSCACRSADGQSSLLVCLQHTQQLCDLCRPNQWTMKYSHKTDKLLAILKELQTRMRRYEVWANEVKTCLNLKDKPQDQYNTTLPTDIVHQYVLPKQERDCSLDGSSSDEQSTASSCNQPPVGILRKLQARAEDIHVSSSDRFQVALEIASCNIAGWSSRLHRLFQLLDDGEDGACYGDERFTCEEIGAMNRHLNLNQQEKETLQSVLDECRQLQQRLQHLLQQADSDHENHDLLWLKEAIKRLFYLNVDDLLQRLAARWPKFAKLTPHSTL